MGNGARCYACVRAKCKYKRASHGCAAVTGYAENPTAIQPNVEVVCINNQRTLLRYQVKTRMGPRRSPWWVAYTAGLRGCLAISCDHLAHSRGRLELGHDPGTGRQGVRGMIGGPGGPTSIALPTAACIEIIKTEQRLVASKHKREERIVDGLLGPARPTRPTK